MGYSYATSFTGRKCLCCDVCENYGGVRKVRCPFDWCPKTALCPKCRRTAKTKDGLPLMSKKAHRISGCFKDSLEWNARCAEKKRMENAGLFLRCSALWHEAPDRVKVIFRGNIEEKAFFMSRETYNSIPLLLNVTPDHYRYFGDIYEAGSLDIYENK